MAQLERLYHKHGIWGIMLSRFVPGLRAVVPPFAGIVGLGAVRTVAPIVVASGIWYGTLTYVAATAIREFQQIARLVQGINRVGLAIGVIAAAAVIVVWWFRRRRKRVLHDAQSQGR